MKYAVISLQGHQYKVQEKEEFLVDLLPEGQKEIKNVEVLLVRDDKKVSIGTPTLKDKKVILKVIGKEKGKKVHVKKFRAKSRYRRKIGFRPIYTRLLVEKIT